MAEAAANVNETSALPDDIRESVAVSNVKTLAEGPAFYSNLAFGNAVAHQQGMNAIVAAIIGKVTEAIISTDPREGGADIAALQQLMKGAQTTPPVTS